MKEIIEKNLELMRSSKKGGMSELLCNESLGGNAGVYKNCSCAGANFYYDKNTGEIIYFGNIQSVPKDIVNNYEQHYFRVALDLWKDKTYIVNFKAPTEASKKAKQTLEETVKEFNSKYGFQD
ncbi:MAG: hypothetical protein KKF52_00990 [Nanoarchaeota archaeon]|nr:hypothetical protein [Nanoarchaeota archaeon]MBU4241784.1 hypothetical protein [Nanoarchaeota archaeon]MBU4352794.1 hypothetical protein [Nanoarchaeota archaeon]MCG2720028.1 hypothetical protein [Nanoarchaeota archaeon]